MGMTLTDRLTRGTYLFDNGPDRPAVICLTYSWMSDALKMLPYDVDQRVKLSLDALGKIYPGRRHREPHRGRPGDDLVGGRPELPRRLQGGAARALPLQPPHVHALHAGRPAARRAGHLHGGRRRLLHPGVGGRSRPDGAQRRLGHHDALRRRPAIRTIPGPGDLFEQLAPVDLGD